MKYRIGLYDPKTKETETIAELPERRQNPNRITNVSVRRYIKSILGEEWYEKNKYFIRVITDHDRLGIEIAY